MRWGLIWIGAIALAAGCSDADPCAFDGYDEQCAASRGEKLIDEPEAPEPNVEIEPELRSELCFSLGPDVETYFPHIKETFEFVAWNWWGWEVVWNDDCLSRIVVGETPLRGDHRPVATAPSLSPEMTAAHVGGWTEIILDVERVESTDLVDILPNACKASNPWRHLLSGVLAHELGHVLLVPHSDDESSLMYADASKCAEPCPTLEELETSLRPYGEGAWEHACVLGEAP